MESANSIVYANTTYTNYIRAYFYKDQDEHTDNMVIVSYDNNRIPVANRKSFQVLIDFVPEDFVEYDFDVIEATSSYLHLNQLSNKYIINFITESTKSSYFDNVYSYEPESELINQDENAHQIETNIVWESTQNPTESDNEMYEYSDGYDSADGYDSEGYYFRVK